MDFQGHINHLESLKTAAGLNADLVLPGHGDPFEPIEAGVFRSTSGVRGTV